MKPENANPLSHDLNDVATAVAAGINIASAKTIKHPVDRHFFLVPLGHELVEPPPLARPHQKLAQVGMNDSQSFAEYVNRHKLFETVIYGAMEPAQFIALLDDHRPSNPNNGVVGSTADTDNGARWRGHKATFVLKHSREWLVWTGHNRKEFAGNKEFALWLEDNTCDVIEPEGRKMLELALGFAVSAGASFSNPIDLDNGSQKLAYTLESKQGELTIPKTFIIEIPVFEGLDAPKYSVEARFRYKLGEGNVAIRYELIRPHKVVEQAFKDVLGFIQSETKVPVFFGTP